MTRPERWEFTRYACDLKVQVFLPSADRPLSEGTFISISLSGGLLVFPGPLWQGIPYVLRLTKLAVPVLPCRVRREAGGVDVVRYYGVSFDLSPEQEDALAGVLASLASGEPAKKAGESCRVCGVMIAYGVGRYLRADESVCMRCNDAGPGKGSHP